MKTPEQRKGTKFEIWLEKLLKRRGYEDVLRNVECHKERYRFRQVDIIYTYDDELRIVEAKYSSDGSISYKLRSTRERKYGNDIIVIENLVDEVLDKKRFVGADAALLVTNNSFEEKVKKESKKHGIIVVEGDVLTRLYHEAGGKGSIDDSINAIDPDKYNQDKTIKLL